MSQPVGVVAPGTFPSFHCAVDSGIVDGNAVKQINDRVAREARQGLLGAGADAYLAAKKLTALKGIYSKDGQALGDKLMSRAFGLRTIGDLTKLSDAAFEAKMHNPIEPLKQTEIDLVRTLRTALLVCKAPNNAPIGHKVSVIENDPTMQATVTRGREVVKANAGKDGYAEVVLHSHPSNNGLVAIMASFLSVKFAGFSERGRGGHVLNHKEFSVSALASGSMQETLERLKDALEAHGMAADIMPASRGGSSMIPTQAIRIWSPLAI